MINEINIDKIVRERAGKKAKYIPKWLTGLLARIIHQEFINVYLRRGRVGVDFCKGVVEYVGAEVSVEGKENLPDDGRLYTFVSNHPLGAIDGVTLGWIIGEHYGGKIKYLVNDLLMNLEGLAPLCVPVNKIGKNARSFPALVDGTFASDCHVIMFPAGLCSRKQDDGTMSATSCPSISREGTRTASTTWRDGASGCICQTSQWPSCPTKCTGAEASTTSYASANPSPGRHSTRQKHPPTGEDGCRIKFIVYS